MRRTVKAKESVIRKRRGERRRQLRFLESNKVERVRSQIVGKLGDLTLETVTVPL